MVPDVGFEPTPLGLRVRYATVNANQGELYYIVYSATLDHTESKMTLTVYQVSCQSPLLKKLFTSRCISL